MENKQTAVEWLEEQFNLGLFFNWKNVFKKAKAMEKEQIKKAYEDGCAGEVFEINCKESSESYYNLKFGELE